MKLVHHINTILFIFTYSKLLNLHEMITTLLRGNTFLRMIQIL